MIQRGCLHMQLQLYVVVSSNCCCCSSHSTCCCCWQHVCSLSSHVKKGKIVFWIPAEFIFGLFVMLCLSVSVLFQEIQFLLVASTVIGHYICISVVVVYFKIAIQASVLCYLLVLISMFVVCSLWFCCCCYCCLPLLVLMLLLISTYSYVVVVFNFQLCCCCWQHL